MTDPRDTPDAHSAGSLSELEDRYRALVESAPFSLVIIQDGIVVYANRTQEALLPSVGRPAEELVKTAMHPEDQEFVAHRIAARERGEEVPHHYRFRQVQGSRVRWMEVWSYRVEYRGRPAIQALTLDVTDQVQAEQIHRSNEERLRILAEHSEDVLMLVGPGDELEHVSAAARRILGRDPDTLTGQGLRALVHPEDADALLASIRDMRGQPGKPIPVRYRAVHADGSLREMSGVGRDLSDEPEIGAVVLNQRDVTELQEMENRLRHSERLEAVGRLAGGVAHDFNNLLTVMMCSARIAAQPRTRDGAATELGRIMEASERGRDLTQRLLTFSRRHVYRPRVVDLNAVLTGLMPMLDRVVEQLTPIRSDFHTGPLWMNVDPGQIEVAVTNLVVNARDAMPRGGDIRITTHRHEVSGERARGKIGATGGPHVVVEVRDAGEGIPREHLDKVFDPYFTTKKPGEGTGLGLSTVLGTMQQAGGFVEIESGSEGRGTVVRLLIPASAAPKARAPEKPAPMPPTLPHARVLVVEDEDMVRDTIAGVLRSRGLEVAVAENAKRAVSILEEAHVDLLLCDVIMPGTSGIQLLETVRERWPALPAILMSGHLGQHVAIPPEVPFLRKPFSPEDLFQALAPLLQGSAARQQKSG